MPWQSVDALMEEATPHGIFLRSDIDSQARGSRGREIDRRNEKIRRMHADGVATAIICEQLGISDATVYRALRRRG